MDDTIQLIDQLIAEHKVINEQAMNIEKTANDASLLKELKKAHAEYLPGQGLQKLGEMLKKIDEFLVKHFSREETVLLPAVQKLNNEQQLIALEARLFEHTDLRDRMYHSKQRVDEMLAGKMAHNLLEAAAGDIKLYVNHTIELLTTHAGNEERYFRDLRQFIQKTEK